MTVYSIFTYSFVGQGKSHAKEKTVHFSLLIRALPVIPEGGDSTAYSRSDFRVQGRVYLPQNIREHACKFQLSDMQMPAKKRKIYIWLTS